LFDQGKLGLIQGKDLFWLYDSFGLRPELVEDIATGFGVGLDLQGFEQRMEEQRERARASWIRVGKPMASPAYLELAMLTPRTQFLGYETTAGADCKILALVANRKVVDGVERGSDVEIVLDRT